MNDLYAKIQPYLQSQKLGQSRLVLEQVHPENPDIRIFNYSHTCQYDRAWDTITRKCRGLILNIRTGEIIANPFEKFFNYGEYQGVIPDEQPIVYEKLDGNLGISYWLPGESLPRIATRGSFQSPGAVWATAWLWNHPGITHLNPKLTHLFEIISPVTKIVVKYPYEELVYLAARVTETGKEVIDPPEASYFRRPEIVPYTALDVLAKMDTPNSEGFVIFYPETGLRIKDKFATYLRIYKVVTGLNLWAIWDGLRQNKNLAPVLVDCPPDFQEWYHQQVLTFQQHYYEILGPTAIGFVELLKSMPPNSPRKLWAETILKRKHPYILFRMLDGQDPTQDIWKRLKPKDNQHVTFTAEG